MTTPKSIMYKGAKYVLADGGLTWKPFKSGGQIAKIPEGQYRVGPLSNGAGYFSTFTAKGSGGDFRHLMPDGKPVTGSPSGTGAVHPSEKKAMQAAAMHFSKKYFNK